MSSKRFQNMSGDISWCGVRKASFFLKLTSTSTPFAIFIYDDEIVHCTNEVSYVGINVEKPLNVTWHQWP